ncbi:hypothetical protein RHGRI_031754 [Rhododendron griersonianum]|uniref:PB1-like domain-containing protein n=1 Tax=Rhododendron griersonianum TaxID=479676 RepID=A0AAV6IEU3_9ERIC|nr:hypothetical protein RHGRI_031754 [Rhododendron griersonianum]
MAFDDWNASLKGAPIYLTDFSIEVHHGGAFTLKPRKVYSGGKIDTVNGLNSDYLSMLELDGLVEQLGYAPNVLLYYKMLNCSLDNGLVPIRCDKDAYGMLDLLHKDRTIVLYFEHVRGLDPIESQVGSSKTGVTQAQVMESQVGSSKNSVAQAQVIDLDVEPQVDLCPATLESHVQVFEEGNMEQGNGLDDVNIEDVNQVDMEDANSDSSSESMYYSDHSYQEGDDDRLYDTFIDQNEEFVGFPDIDERNPHVEPIDDQGQLSDGDPKGAAGPGRGVTIRGGGVFRGGATLRSNQLNIPTNYDQATQVSQTSTVTVVRKDKRMATIATLYGNKP